MGSLPASAFTELGKGTSSSEVAIPLDGAEPKLPMTCGSGYGKLLKKGSFHQEKEKVLKGTAGMGKVFCLELICFLPLWSYHLIIQMH